MHTSIPASQLDFGRKWHVMATVSMGTFLGTIDSSIVNIALPTLVKEYATNFSTVQWVVLIYLLTVTTLMLSVGRLADMLGKKYIYLAGFGIFTLGSALCGLAPGIYWLIGFRVLQAVGAVMVVALGMAIVTEAFPAQERGKALGINGAVVSLGIVLGPTLGGIIIQSLSWHWIFFVNLPVGLIGMWMVWRNVPATQPAGGQHFDFGGALTLFVSMLAFLLALTAGQNYGFSDWRVASLFVLWAVFLALFVRIELHASQPMIDLSLFRNILFRINLITGFLSFIVIAGTILIMPFYLENILGYPTSQAGLLMGVLPVALGLTAPVSGVLSDRHGTRLITMVGLMILVIGYLTMSTLTQTSTSLEFALRILPIGLGMGIFQSPNNSAIMGSAPRERLGVVSGMLAISRTLGQTTGIAILGAIWAARVFASAGGVVSGGATAAPSAAQVAGLQETFLIMVGMIALAMVLAVWAFLAERRNRASKSVATDLP